MKTRGQGRFLHMKRASEAELIQELEMLNFARTKNNYLSEKTWKGSIPKAGSREDDIIYYLRVDYGYDAYIENNTYYIGKAAI